MRSRARFGVEQFDIETLAFRARLSGVHVSECPSRDLGVPVGAPILVLGVGWAFPERSLRMEGWELLGRCLRFGWEIRGRSRMGLSHGL